MKKEIGKIPSQRESKQSRTWLWRIALAASLLVGLAACQLGEDRLRSSGATTLVPFFSTAMHAYAETEPGLQIEITGGGSSKGILDVATGAVDFGGSARDPKHNETQRVLFIPIARDAIAVVAHTDVPISDISADSLRHLYAGKTQEVGFEGLAVIGKAAAHGTHQSFKSAIEFGEGDMKPNAEAGSNGELIAYVVASRGIGYVSLPDAQEAIRSGEPLKILSVDGVTASVSAATDSSYSLARTLYLLLPRTSSDGALRPSVHANGFAKFIASPEGRSLILNAGFAPLQ